MMYDKIATKAAVPTAYHVSVLMKQQIETFDGIPDDDLPPGGPPYVARVQTPPLWFYTTIEMPPWGCYVLLVPLSPCAPN